MEQEESSGKPAESGSDVDMIDEELDKKELKALQKEAGKIDTKSGRPKRTRK